MHLALTALAVALPTGWADWEQKWPQVATRPASAWGGRTLGFAPSCYTGGWPSHVPLETCIGGWDHDPSTSFKITCGEGNNVVVTEFSDVACTNESRSYSEVCKEKCPAFGGPVPYAILFGQGGISFVMPVGICILFRRGTSEGGVPWVATMLITCVKEDEEVHRFQYSRELCEGPPFEWGSLPSNESLVRCTPSTEAAPGSTVLPVAKPASCDARVDEPETLHFGMVTWYNKPEGGLADNCSAPGTAIRSVTFVPLDLCHDRMTTRCDGDHALLEEVYNDDNCTERNALTRYTSTEPSFRCATCPASSRPQHYVHAKLTKVSRNPADCSVEGDSDHSWHPTDTCAAVSRWDVLLPGGDPVLGQWFSKFSCDNVTSSVVIVKYIDEACQEEHSRTVWPYGCSTRQVDSFVYYAIDVSCSKFGKASPASCPRWQAGAAGTMTTVDAATPQFVGIAASLVGLATAVLWL